MCEVMMTRSYWDLVSYLKPLFKKVHKFSKFLASNYSKSSHIQSFTAFLMFGSIICFLIVMGSSFFYMYPSPETLAEINQNRDININTSSDYCNVFDGKWVIDENYPLYNSSQCPFAERGFNCLANGRRDKDYLKWRWKPKNCEILRFDAHAVLELLRGKRVVFVGDSLSRTQWESMICMLMSGVDDKNSVYEINGNAITKRIGHLGVRFGTYGLTVEFYRSVFLVQPGPAPRHSPKRVKTVLKLDQMDEISQEWVDSDILVFNSGHWWTQTKLFEMGWYFQIGGRIKFGLPISSAFKVALATWRSWVDNAVNPNMTRVFFRTFESTHWSSGSRQNCKVTTWPSLGTKGRQRNSISDAIINAVKNASTNVNLLHVTPMTAFRSDAHVGSWSDNPSVPDCSHWCLPGVPDVWNELLFSFLLSNPNRS
ncbi:protein trichome berefringence-like 7 [Phtheirospermum japonicum]|uniref:Protein trichome berefringence-like 7 n=1 Tax=Phtheirospermum japonicum TaxID=374723 RepID=A0A830D7J9_9LAMI|nr:protein trichome berefringence-like 7 [Phtheirospermum japonicum]